MNTVRKYPRTMREAFQDADYASAVERSRSTGHKVANITMVLAAIAVVAVLFGVL